MSELETKLKLTIKDAFKKVFSLDVEENNIIIEIPKNVDQGDYSTTIAMRYAKQLQNNPRVIAEKLKEELLHSSLPIEKIEIAGPGFINFYFKKSALANVINTVLDLDSKYGIAIFLFNPDIVNENLE